MIPTQLRNPHLLERLRELSGQSVVFHPTPGNAGDSLIQAATYQIFEDLNIKFTLLADAKDVRGKTVIIGGGGNLVPAYTSVRKAFLLTARVAKNVILLPHTIRGNEDLLEDLGPSVEIYCRDPESYLHVLHHRSRAKVRLGHDMAFSVDVDRLRSRYGNQADELLRQKVPTTPLEALLAESRHRFFFRKDKEKTNRLMPKSSRDISSIFKTGTLPGQAQIGALAMLNYVDRAHEIHTDRLHVGLSGAILGKRVYLYDNSYGKLAAVYRHSLHEFFPFIQLIP